MPITQETQTSQFWLTADEAAERLGIKKNSLANWRYSGRAGQPRFYKTGAKSVRYKASDIDAWIEANSFAY